jgi:hypothetical protein
MNEEINSGLLQDVRDLEPALSASAADGTDGGTDGSPMKKGDTDGTDAEDQDGTDATDADGTDDTDTDGTDDTDSDGTDDTDTDGTDNA